MTAPGKKPDHAAPDAFSAFLRIVVAACLLFISAGTFLSFTRGGYGTGASEVARLIGPGGSFPGTASWMLGGLRRLDGQSVIVAGLPLLIAIPFLQVAASMVVFARQRDRTHVATSATVLILLLASFVLGR